jgi:hypothetical protein
MINNIKLLNNNKLYTLKNRRCYKLNINTDLLTDIVNNFDSENKMNNKEAIKKINLLTVKIINIINEIEEIQEEQELRNETNIQYNKNNIVKFD